MLMEMVALKISKQFKQWTCDSLGLEEMLIQPASIFEFAAWIYCESFFFTLPGLGKGTVLSF